MLLHARRTQHGIGGSDESLSDGELASFSSIVGTSNPAAVMRARLVATFTSWTLYSLSVIGSASFTAASPAAAASSGVMSLLPRRPSPAC